MASPSHLKQLRKLAAARTTPLPEFRPWEFQRVEVKLEFDPETELWTVKHRKDSGWWSGGLPATNYLISLWMDLQETRRLLSAARKQIEKLKSMVE